MTLALFCIPPDHQGVKEKIDSEHGIFGKPPDPSVPAGLQALPHPLSAHDLLLHHVEPHHYHHPPHTGTEFQARPSHLAIPLLLGSGLHLHQLGPKSYSI